MWQHISTVGRDLIDASVFMVDRPGLDPGTLGLKVQIKRLQPDASCYSRSQMAGAKRNRKSSGDGLKRGGDTLQHGCWDRRLQDVR